MSIKERLLSGIIIDEITGCWNWQKASTNKGYGAMKVFGILKNTHRLSYEEYHGPIPNGMMICHKCDNPPCINPEHLFLGTRSDNMKDCVNKGRSNIKTIVNPKKFKEGNLPTNSQLTREQATEIKKLISEKGSKTLKKLAEELHLSYQLLRDINCGKSYSTS